MWNGEVKRSARLRQGGFVDAKSGDLHSSPCRPYMVLRSKRGGSDQTTYMFPRLSKCLNLDVYWAVKTQSVRHTAYWIKASPPPLVYITVHWKPRTDLCSWSFIACTDGQMQCSSRQTDSHLPAAVHFVTLKKTERPRFSQHCTFPMVPPDPL